MGLVPRLLIVVVLAAWLAPSTGARAQLFSPGALSKAHAHLDGLDSCLKCHEPGNKLSNTRCLDCHTELKVRVAEGAGFHGRLPKSRSCASCHREHRGAKAKLIPWGAGKSAFDHSRSGWPLEGGHKKAKCADCHQPRLIRDKRIQAAQKKWKHRDTMLGLSTTCASCHFDEHRGQVKGACDKCHVEKAFAPAPRFSHNKMSAFSLTGRHKKVACAKCHDNDVDNRTPASAFPAPKSKTFTQYDDIPHARCTDCHSDPHKGKMGRRCERCHSTRGWKAIRTTAQDTGFHDKSGFPLQGAHIDVACKTCHGPFRGQKAVFKGLAHDRCTDCHNDGHVGQLPSEKGGKGPGCKRCHSVKAFVPTRYDAEAHKGARFPLEGSHRAVPCARCHKKDKRLAQKVPKATQRLLKQRDRRALVSTRVLRLPRANERCESCHDDVHKGQFAERVKAKGCNACHRASSFADLSFDHDKDSAFPLEGAHARASCTGCHRPGGDGLPAKVIRYRPVENECQGCHTDVHAGQFADAAMRTDCRRCHGADAFSPPRFDHNDAAFTSFALRGRHTEVKCASCHRTVEVQPGVQASWYRGIPKTCAGCHADQHQGRFEGFEP
jgi:hypothetical protein